MKLSRLLIPAMAALLMAGQALAEEKLRVGYLRVMDDAQAIAAYEGGFYKKHGLDVELVEFTSGTDLIKAIVGGQLDTGVLGFTNAASWSSRGADLKVVGGAQHGYHAIVVRNDANMAAYAEWSARAARSSTLLFIGLGTGIGGGYVEDGWSLGGCNDRAVEIGHFIVEPGGRPCPCGVSGCAEAYASGPSIGRIAVDLALGRDAGLGSLEPENIDRSFGGSALAARARAGEVLNAHDVYAAFAKGDALARFVDAVAAAALARAAATGLALLAPDTLVLGGGVIEGAPHLCSSIQGLLGKLVYRDAWRDCPVEKALFLHKAGLYGAALYGASRVESEDGLTALAARALELASSTS